jgi:hypothetical protein
MANFYVIIGYKLLKILVLAKKSGKCVFGDLIEKRFAKGKSLKYNIDKSPPNKSCTSE